MKSLHICYQAKIKSGTDGYSVEFFDLPAFSSGDTLEEALYNAQESLDCALLGVIDEDDDIPVATKHKGDDVFDVYASPEVAVPILLRVARKRSGKTLTDVAKSMDVSFQRYHDIEKGRNITLKTLRKAAASLGANVDVRFVM
ncbi:MAG: type II toxin-antitoxin system HicB family antitoxin [Proteobacteria bacterium]|nr:type II toxin-antitoxin system HicB family antitoxin [Pseudomonadota bacterium]